MTNAEKSSTACAATELGYFRGGKNAKRATGAAAAADDTIHNDLAAFSVGGKRRTDGAEERRNTEVGLKSEEERKER